MIQQDADIFYHSIWCVDWHSQCALIECVLFDEIPRNSRVNSTRNMRIFELLIFNNKASGPCSTHKTSNVDVRHLFVGIHLNYYMAIVPFIISVFVSRPLDCHSHPVRCCCCCCAGSFAIFIALELRTQVDVD